MDILTLSPQEFDQSELWQRRNIQAADIACVLSQDTSAYHDIIFEIKLYLAKIKMPLYRRQLMQFHIAQLYAFAGDYDSALMYITQLLQQNYDKIDPNYLKATHAFWSQDRDRLMACGDDEFVLRLQKNFDKTHLEAYNDMLIDDMKAYIIA